ncbi:MAG: division/cell wall cluster transcriptional repressor MraZ, partial [Clostridia bacterium]|nr:division/cell wall cluster transcriptional repressor MraZ [Clostridia bacterium]
MEEWDKLTQKISSLPQIQTRDIIRFLFSSAVEVQTDKQGRIVLPAELIEYAEIKKTAVIVGVGNHVEIWSDKNWEAKKEELTSANLLDMLKELGF